LRAFLRQILIKILIVAPLQSANFYQYLPQKFITNSSVFSFKTSLRSFMLDKLKEECAIAGVCIRAEESAGRIYNALLSLQHRAQEGAGIAVLRENRINVYKRRGLVSEVFTDETLKSLPRGGLAIGHTRYSTTGSNTVSNVQPFVTEYLTGRIATAHNGNIVNAKQLKETLKKLGIDFGIV
jgi:amidophosphoribosyltransferase